MGALAGRLAEVLAPRTVAVRFVGRRVLTPRDIVGGVDGAILVMVAIKARRNFIRCYELTIKVLGKAIEIFDIDLSL